MKANRTVEMGAVQLLLAMLAVGLASAGAMIAAPPSLPAWAGWILIVAGIASAVAPVKRNRDLDVDENAVSPVIAVILMVAITVVLAATVFVLVSDIDKNNASPAPQIAWREDQQADTLTVQQAPTGLVWSSFTVNGCTTIPTGTLDAGDFLAGCAGSVTVRHNPSNSLVYSGTFG